MPDASASASPQSADIHFCTECLTTLKQPTTWCSLTCADANFQRHREEVHLSERKKLGLPHMDDGEGEKKEKEKEEGEGEGEEGKTQIEYLTGTDGNDNDNGNGNDNRGGRSKYRAKDIRALTTSLEQAVQEWEGRNRVRLQVQGSD